MDGALVLRRILTESSTAFGFDAEKERYGDMMEFGIVDPTKVTRCALQNAASVSSLLLMTDALVADVPEDEKGAGPGGPGMDDMGDMGF